MSEWISHNIGVPHNLDPSAIVEAVYRDGFVDAGMVFDFDWMITGDSYDIMAYRVIDDE